MKKLKDIMSTMMLISAVNLKLFDGEVLNTTESTGLSPEMKTFYYKQLIEMAGPELYHDQFGQKRNIPKNGGKTIEFRKYSPLPKALTPLTEGVTPKGQNLNVSTIEATVKQYGGFVPVSDILSVVAIDNNIAEATTLLASQAGRTLDTVTREVLNGGTNVVFAGGVSARHLLTGNSEHFLTVDCIKRAVRNLKAMNARKINGYYVGIINQDVSYDLTNDPNWKYPHQYKDTKELYSGEIGAIAGVRFVETSEAKKFVASDLWSGGRELYTSEGAMAFEGKTIKLGVTISESDALALVGRRIIVREQQGEEFGEPYYFTVVSATTDSITVDGNLEVYPGDVTIFPGDGGADGRDVYSTLIIGADAYGVTEIDGLGLEHIFKPLGSAGAADPLNQRATCGWKASKTAERLVEEYMVRIESTSTFSDGVAN